MNRDSDFVEKQIEIAAPVGRVWMALTDSRQFGEWFRVSLEGPFVAGAQVGGMLKIPGYEHVRMEVKVKTIQPETYFSYTWHPCAVDPGVDYTQETPTLLELRLQAAGGRTLLEFRLQAAGGRTLLTLKESGFDSIPTTRQAEAFRRNNGGWTQQMKNLEAYACKTS